MVGFTDFILFAQAFGAALGSPNYDAQLDLDQDDSIGFTDFIQFAQAFVKSVSELGKPARAAKPVGLFPGVNGDASLSLIQQPGAARDRVTVAVRLTGAVQVQRYGLRVAYDASALEFAGADGASASLFAGDNAASDVALQVISAPGEALLADAFRPDAAVQGESDLVLLYFRVRDETLSGRVSLVEALVSDGIGRIDHLAGAHLDDVRAMPSNCALSQNFPNPFNPETAVPFALPEAGDVRISVYNVLGQEVAVIAEGYRSAGYHRAVWDGKDMRGRPAASGIYFVRMATQGFADMRKMLLVK